MFLENLCGLEFCKEQNYRVFGMIQVSNKIRALALKFDIRYLRY